MSVSRGKLIIVGTSFFVAGVLFASNLDWTRRANAQAGAASKAKATAFANTLGDGFASIAEQVTPSVVSIQAVRSAPSANQRLRRQTPPGSIEEFFNLPQRQQVPQESSGSGFIVSKDGYILTNNHVVEGADRLTVLLTDQRQFTAKVIGRDPDTDVAVIKIDGKDFPTAALGDDSKLRIGEWVVAIGNPLGLDFTVTAGIVSARGRGGNELPGLNRSNYAISDFIQTDAAINPGNSGGPLVNTRGEVIGVNSAIASQTGFYSGYGFAIPVTLAKQVMDDLIAHGRVRRAVIGVSINDVNAEDAAVAGLKTVAGVKVGGFSDDDSPAKKAGIEPGDIIVKADDKPIDRVSTLQRIIRAHAPGETVTLEALRYGTRKTFRVKLTEAPADRVVASNDDESPSAAAVPASAAEKLGISVEPLTAEAARTAKISEANRGVLVSDVDQNGPARNKLVPRGDVIVEVLFPEPKVRINGVADLQRAMARVKGGEFVSLLVYNPAGGQTRVVNMRVAEK